VVRFAVRPAGPPCQLSVSLLITAAFAMIHAIPGDPVRGALGIKAPQSLVTAKRHALGLDKPLWRQYVDFLHGVITGHLACRCAASCR